MSSRPLPHVTERNARLVAYILAGGQPKVFGMENNMTESNLWHTLRKLGLRKHWLTPDEVQAINASRMNARNLLHGSRCLTEGLTEGPIQHSSRADACEFKVGVSA